MTLTQNPRDVNLVSEKGVLELLGGVIRRYAIWFLLKSPMKYGAP